MFDFLKIDGKFYNMMSKFVDMMLINVLFVISSIPIITIGAGITASHTIYNNYSLGETDQIISRYIEAFKKNFKQSTIVHIFLAVVFTVLIINLRLFPYYQANLKWLVLIALIAFLLFFYFYSILIYPYLSKFYDTLKVASSNTIKMVFTNFFKVLGSGIWTCLPLVIMVMYPWTLPIFLYYYLFFGFSLNFYINTLITGNIFEKYIPEEEL